MQKFVLFGENVYMRKVFFKSFLSFLVCLAMIFSCSVSVFALDDKYTIDELNMSIKIPKEYTVITRTLERDDEAFSELSLDYDETMTAFSAAHIYLQAISDDDVLKITLTKTADENSKAIYNYSELSKSERNTVLEAFLNSGNYTSGVEIKHNGNIYFDLALTQKTQGAQIYCYQCHTVINGMNINLTLQKDAEELTADEIRVITDMANTISFDIVKNGSGPSFEWWRFLLWIVILVAVAFLAKYLYAQYNERFRKKPSYKKDRKPVLEDGISHEESLLESQPQYKEEKGNLHKLLSELGIDDNEDDYSFDELLGYDTTDYHDRANTEFDDFDINVKAKDKNSGMSYFEDSGKGINEKSDYFEDFFSDEDEEVVAKSEKSDNGESKAGELVKRFGYFRKNLSTEMKKRFHKR